MQNQSKLLLKTFPLSNQKGGDIASVKTLKMQQIAQQKTPLTEQEIKVIIRQHHQFLSTGGAGGKWQTLQMQGMVMGVYAGADSSAGTQAILEKRHISDEFDLQEIILPFANFCGVYCPNQDFSEADLSHCLFTDALLKNTIFADTKLQHTDFSRANLRNASFMNADLRYTDFEHADLTNADFRGALLDGAVFPGAKLKGVIY
jgi:uncharacterized protein YjbI with pentapeptide repeats